MLPAQNRLRQSADFRATVRRGVRAASTTVVVHARPTSPPVRVGFVVSKAVGNAVTRNRVKRRLRHLVVPLLEDAPAMSVVVRALPAAAEQPERLAGDLVHGWGRVARRLASPVEREGAGR